MPAPVYELGEPPAEATAAESLAAAVSAHPIAALSWLVTEAAPARPWLPTTAEQDRAWQDRYGERIERMRSGQALAGHVAARAPMPAAS